MESWTWGDVFLYFLCTTTALIWYLPLLGIVVFLVKFPYYLSVTLPFEILTEFKITSFERRKSDRTYTTLFQFAALSFTRWVLCTFKADFTQNVFFGELHARVLYGARKLKYGTENIGDFNYFPHKSGIPLVLAQNAAEPHSQGASNSTKGYWVRSRSRHNRNPDLVIYFVPGNLAGCASSYIYVEFLSMLLVELQVQGFRNPVVYCLDDNYYAHRGTGFDQYVLAVQTGWYIASTAFPHAKTMFMGSGIGGTALLSLLLHITRPTAGLLPLPKKVTRESSSDTSLPSAIDAVTVENDESVITRPNRRSPVYDSPDYDLPRSPVLVPVQASPVLTHKLDSPVHDSPFLDSPILGPLIHSPPTLNACVVGSPARSSALNSPALGPHILDSSLDPFLSLPVLDPFPTSPTLALHYGSDTPNRHPLELHGHSPPVPESSPPCIPIPAGVPHLLDLVIKSPVIDSFRYGGSHSPTSPFRPPSNSLHSHGLPSHSSTILNPATISSDVEPTRTSFRHCENASTSDIPVESGLSGFDGLTDCANDSQISDFQLELDSLGEFPGEKQGSSELPDEPDLGELIADKKCKLDSPSSDPELTSDRQDDIGECVIPTLRKPDAVLLISPLSRVAMARKDKYPDFMFHQVLSQLSQVFRPEQKGADLPCSMPGCIQSSNWWAEAIPARGIAIHYGGSETQRPEIEQLIELMRSVESPRVISQCRDDEIHAWPIAAAYTGRTTTDQIDGVSQIANDVAKMLVVECMFANSSVYDG